MAGPVRKHSVTIAGHSTSLTLEEPFWRELRVLAAKRSQSINALVAEVDAKRDGNLSSALRLLVLESYRSGELGRG